MALPGVATEGTLHINHGSLRHEAFRIDVVLGRRSRDESEWALRESAAVSRATAAAHLHATGSCAWTRF
ncbi:MAG: hypothetical protein INR71_03265 [Terriglobus roseus]|nr:hypothetical protein [Terriglobus roseus]